MKTVLSIISVALLAGCAGFGESDVQPGEIGWVDAETGENVAAPNIKTGSVEKAGQGVPHPESQWREFTTEADQKRLDDWEKALETGRDGAIKGGSAAEISARSPLFDTNAAMADSKLPAGLYNCSITKLDGNPDGGLPYVAYPAFKCRVVDEEDGRKHFTKLTGSQRTIGWIYEVGTRHSIYLGSLIYHYEDALISYGKTPERDQAAVVQRIGANRWRMVFPYPYYESQVDVMELTPAR